MCKLSIIMPVYNGEAFIKETLDSVLNQKYDEWECLIYDDNSSDRTKKIIRDYVNKEDRFILIEGICNIGAAGARNECIKRAKGKYIAILDSDDVCCKDRFKNQIKFLEENEEFDIVAGRAIHFNGVDEWTPNIKTGKIEKKDLKKGMPFVHSTLVTTSKSIKNIGGYPNHRRVQDYAMVMNLIGKGYEGVILDQYVVKYRCDNNNYKRRTLKSRINEVKIRYIGYKELEYNWKEYIYIFKPLIAMLVPKKIMKIYHKRGR